MDRRKIVVEIDDQTATAVITFPDNPKKKSVTAAFDNNMAQDPWEQLLPFLNPYLSGEEDRPRTPSTKPEPVDVTLAAFVRGKLATFSWSYDRGPEVFTQAVGTKEVWRLIDQIMHPPKDKDVAF